MVTHDVEPYTIAGGVPAKPIRKRFDPDTIQTLLDLRWWDLPEKELKPLLPLIQRGNTEALLHALRP